MANILDASALISLLPTLLPESDKTLKSPEDGLAALSHTILSALAFRLVGVDDSSSVLHTSSNTFPAEWNKNGPGNYTFRYKHDQSSLEFLIKVSRMGARLLFNAIAIESDKVASLDIPTNDFVSPAAFPHVLGVADAQPLVHCFISSARVTDFVSQYKLKIIQKLIPGLRKDGYTEEDVQTQTQAQTQTTSNDNNRRGIFQEEPRIPRYDPSEEFPYRGPSHLPPQNPLQIGRRDLDPLPGGSFQPPPLFPPDNDDGMFVGPNHPIFGRRGHPSGNRGPWGGDGFLPPMGAPPGARFDPVGPMGPNTGPFPGNFGPGRGGNLPGSGNMRGPDNDEFMPPGAGDMYM
ncbi:hypothetical protein Moror_17549 [Moniliophthora roreri MCA 2997]|uniref:Uncharacterized protein n=2 Tax=Moniliophthora roreri TaxID=221103 RepID=V2Z0Q0_MONRO|nr:hypothetical protein Moror_17549 [Moniliophthora roreri MCA 2997]KAI3612397.1 hypothetical protein WG66_009944 [Moniliophthora roreri]